MLTDEGWVFYVAEMRDFPESPSDWAPVRATESEEGERGGAHVEQRRKQQLDLRFNLEMLLLTRFDYMVQHFFYANRHRLLSEGSLTFGRCMEGVAQK